MPDEHADAFYTELFTRSENWSTPYPNVEEARRVAAVLPLLSEAAHAHRRRHDRPMRILDLGCGRGWLTYLAAPYGECRGIDPVAPVVEAARQRFPQLRFDTGTATDLLEQGCSGRFDVVLASEVVEHVPPPERDEWVADIGRLLVREGAAVVSSDRGELYERWMRSGAREQPVEDWMTEAELRDLFARHGFVAERHERVNYRQAALSPLHRALADRRVVAAAATLRQRWLLEGLAYALAECQVWRFRFAPGAAAS